MAKARSRYLFEVLLGTGTLRQQVHVVAKFMIVNHRGDLCFADRDPVYNGNSVLAHTVFRSGTWIKANAAPEPIDEPE